MKVFSRIGKFCITSVLLVVVSLLSGTAVFAEEDAAEFGISISPTIIELENLNPGDSTRGSVIVSNIGQHDCTFTISFQPFNVSDENYETDLSKTTQYNDIINWATFSTTSGFLKAGESQEIEFIIRVPKDVPAGGQYGVITAEASNQEEDSASASISINRQVGTIVYTQITGQTRLSGSVEENKVPGILFNPPITATSIVENTGNTHITASYILQVFPLFSDEEVYTNEDNPETSLILPETRRFNAISWDGAPHLGIFRVKQTIKVFDREDITEKIVFLCPIWLLFIVFLIIFCVVFWIITRIKARKQS